MITVHQILQRQKQGDTTTGTILDVLSLSNERAISETLKNLPVSVLRELKKFVGYYTPNTRIFRAPRPKTRAIQYVRRWFHKEGDRLIRRQKPSPDESHIIQTVPIGNNTEFKELQAFANSMLGAKCYRIREQKGSSSWIDPGKDVVRFKLCNCRTGFFFGVREEWASVLSILFSRIGSKSFAFKPSPVRFRGDFVTSTPSGRRCIKEIVALFPPAFDIPVVQAVPLLEETK